MIVFKKGDILKQDAEALVNTVNCVGVMGRGVALQFRKAFPLNYKEYEKACARKEVVPGQMFIFDTGSFCNPRYIINFPTKRHWKGKSRMEDIQRGLVALVKEIRTRNIRSIAIPPLGCGLGGLNWSDVKVEIEKALNPLTDVEVILFEPAGAPMAHDMVKNADVPNMTVGRATLVTLMRKYLAAVMAPSITLLELQKLMYFMQVAGEPLKLNYSKAVYGPFADNLGKVLNKIEGHFTIGYMDGGDSPEKPLELKEGSVEEAEKFLIEHPATSQRFDRVTKLISGFETPYGMELLSTIHWVVTQEKSNTLEDTIIHVHNWSERKRRFPEKHIQIAFEALNDRGWFATSDKY